MPATLSLPQTAPLDLAPGRLHEIHGRAGDWAAALGFALGAARGRSGATVMVRARWAAPLPLRIYGEGLADLGHDPRQLLIVEARDERDLLRAALDAARCPGLAAVILETWKALPAYDLTVSRRLVLAAERSGVPVIVLRGDAEPRASAAHSRWDIASAPSAAWLAQAPGHPAIEAALLRRRGGPADLRWHLNWDENDGWTPHPGAVVPLAAERASPASRVA
jgi:protein ImuA